MTRREKRLAKFWELRRHPFYCSSFMKLNEPELAELKALLDKWGGLSKNEFAERVNRLYIDINPKPKKLNLFCDLLLACNNI